MPKTILFLFFLFAINCTELSAPLHLNPAYNKTNRKLDELLTDSTEEGTGEIVTKPTTPTTKAEIPTEIPTVPSTTDDYPIRIPENVTEAVFDSIDMAVSNAQKAPSGYSPVVSQKTINSLKVPTEESTKVFSGLFGKSEVSVRDDQAVDMSLYVVQEVDGKSIDFNGKDVVVNPFVQEGNGRLLQEGKGGSSIRLFNSTDNVVLSNVRINILFRGSTGIKPITITKCGIFDSLSDSILTNVQIVFYNNIAFDCDDERNSHGVVANVVKNVTFNNVVIEFLSGGVRTISINAKDNFGFFAGDAADEIPTLKAKENLDEHGNITFENCHVFGDILTVIGSSQFFGGFVGHTTQQCSISKSYLRLSYLMLYQEMTFGGFIGKTDNELEITDSFISYDGLVIGVENEPTTTKDKENNGFVYGGFIGKVAESKLVTIDKTWITFTTKGIEINSTVATTSFGGMIGKSEHQTTKEAEPKTKADQDIDLTYSSISMKVGHNRFIFGEQSEALPIGFIFGSKTIESSHSLANCSAYIEACPKNAKDCISPILKYYGGESANPTTTPEKRMLDNEHNDNYAIGDGVDKAGNIFSSTVPAWVTASGIPLVNGIPFYGSYNPNTMPSPQAPQTITIEPTVPDIVPSLRRCPNECNGNGQCVYGQCRCNPTYTGFDCSSRTCPYGTSLTDPRSKPTLDKRTYLECSNQGECDRSTGDCTCNTGFEGSNCQRTKCPNQCSNHGICATVSEAIMLNDELDISYTKLYDKWDSDSVQVCVCDKEYTGADCSEKKCPRGYARKSDCDSPAQTQITIKYTAPPTLSQNNLVYVSFTDPLNRVWFSEAFDFKSQPEWVNAISSLAPDALSINPDVSVDTINSPITVTIGFTQHQTGRQIPFKVYGSSEVAAELAKNEFYHWFSTNDKLLKTDDTSFKYEIDYAQQHTECSNNGICDTKTGICTCFDGLFGIACGEHQTDM